MHDFAKHKIDIFQHLFAASEIFVQLDFLAFGSFFGISIVLFHKQFRTGKAETVDALFYIPDHEHVVLSHAAPGNAGQDQFLHHIAVLIFIDHNLFKLICKGSCRFRRNFFSIFFSDKDLQCKMLQIRKIKKIPLLFLSGKPPAKFLCKFDQHLHGNATFLDFLQHCLRILIKILFFQRGNSLFDLITQQFYLFFFLFGYFLILFSGKHCKLSCP